MSFLPVVERELRVAARRRQTYWMRSAAVLVIIGSCTWLWCTLGQGQLEMGQTLFRFVAGISFTYSLFIGVATAADAISEEKREGTLGLLFLTDLKGYDVVLGKLAATSLHALYRLFSIFPILTIPLILGGLTLAESARMALVSTNALLFSLSVGILASALSVRERRGRLAAFLMILAATAGPPLLGLCASLRHSGAAYNQNWLLFSIVAPFGLAFAKPYAAHPHFFWAMTAAIHLLAWCFLVVASVAVRRTWQDRPAAGARARWQEQWQVWRFGEGPARAGFRTRLLDMNPILWHLGRDRLKPAYVWGWLAVLGLLWLWGYHMFRSAMLDPATYCLAAYALHTFLKLWLASESCRCFAEHRRTGALELILSTPLNVDQILDGAMRALKRQFLGPALLILLVDFLLLLGGMREEADFADWVMLMFALAGLFIADLYTLAWVGMWLGLKARKTSRATAGNVARVLILPWVVYVLGLSVLGVYSWRGFDPSPTSIVTAGFVLAFLNDAMLLNWARSNLRRRFRLVATEGFQSKTSHSNPAATPLAEPPGQPALAQ
jgi:ABC-type transport system involved in cytochrome c biogenesis permease component